MSDLDARVAALPKRYKELQKSGIGTDTDPKSLIIKALQDKIVELQKPALHEPVRDRASIESSCRFIEQHTATRRCDSPAVSDCWRCNSVYLAKRMRDFLTSFDLQGRAQPATEEITDAERFQYLCLDITDSAERAVRNALLDRLCTMSYSAACIDIDAAIRASKGGKT